MRRAVRQRFLAALAALALVPVNAAERSLLHKPAPQLVRRDLNGNLLNLRHFRGKVVLLNFWATWCAPCQEELPLFAAWQKQYGPEGLRVIAVSMDDDAGAARALVGKLKLDFPVVMGDAAIGRRYGGVLGLPVTFLIGRDGMIEARSVGEVPFGNLETKLKQLLDGH